MGASHALFRSIGWRSACRIRRWLDHQTGSFAGFPLTQDLVAGTTYYICLGQFSTVATTTVAGSLNISGPEGSACAGDFNNDGVRDGADLGTLLASFGFDAGGDMNGDGVTDGADLGALLAVFGTACQ